MTEANDRGRLVRTVWAGVLAVSITGLTIALFDEDLGTPAPLFGEWTCLLRGDLDVVMTDGFDRPSIGVPQTALKIFVNGSDVPASAYVSVYKRERGEEWTLYFAQAVHSYPYFLVINPTTNETEVYATARDLEGKYCEARSPTLQAPAGSSGASDITWARATV